MTRATRWLALLVATLLSLFAASRIYGLMQADASLQSGDADAVVRWRADDPRGLLLRAEAQLAAKSLQGAESTARHLLQVSPTDGRGYRVLAQVAQEQGQSKHARILFGIAARRAPRDLPARAWLAQDALLRGDYQGALVQIDAVLTMSPGAGSSTFPVLIKLAEDPAFATSLAQSLRAKPTWRPSLMAALAAPDTGSSIANDLVLGALQRNGGLDQIESAAWLEALLRQGRWGEAHARWASPIVASGQRLAPLFNGDFGQDPAGSGFDWRRATVPGVIVDFEPMAGLQGRAAHLRFLGRRVSGSLLVHPLLLSPGKHRLAWRERSDALRGDTGIEWRLVCAGSADVLARSEAMTGSVAWRSRDLYFEIPQTGCPGLWLSLAPAGTADTGQILSGHLWVGQVELLPLRSPR